MPTPVSIARQNLTDESARVLDDAVTVARRRSHAQTTSLHAISALLALPYSTLRDACARGRSSALSPRLHFKALELSVGVSLDRLPSSKTCLEEPPVSNSLMAVIKRSQANQRRQPENFYLYQIHNQYQTTPVLKVELKHLVVSILDDPIVSRVFGEAGFNSNDIKFAIMQPPVSQFSGFSRTRCPPIFLSNLTDSDPSRRSFGFPFASNENGDVNSRRIGEVLVKRSGRNPLLVGVCSSEALRDFIDGVDSGKVGVLPSELVGLRAVCIKKEISEFVVEGGNEEKMGLKFKEVSVMAEQCSGHGVILNFGELKLLVADGTMEGRVSFVVSNLKTLLEIHVGKLWVIGAAETYEIYLKFLDQFPSIEKELDLHLLPISSTKGSMEGLYPKSSLLGSFVPFGGFFATTCDDLKDLVDISRHFSTRCPICNEKYEQEVASVIKGGSPISVSDRHMENLPQWMQMAEVKKGKGIDVAKTKNDGTTIIALQRKWNEVCQRIHHTQPYSKVDTSQPESQVTSAGGFLAMPNMKAHNSQDSSPRDSRSSFPSTSVPKNMRNNFPFNQDMLSSVPFQTENVYCHRDQSQQISNSWQTEIEMPCIFPYAMHSANLPNRMSCSSATSVTTDLGLGPIHASTCKEAKHSKLNDHNGHSLQFRGSFSAEIDVVRENNLHQIVESSSRSASNFGVHCDPSDLKSLKRALIEKVWWQDEAASTIIEAVCCCRSGDSNLRRGIWLTLLGPDKIGKKKIASVLAESLHGTSESLISVDLCSQDKVFSENSFFEHQESDYLKFRGKTVIDYLVGELRRKPHSVMFLENVDRADFLARNSMSQAIRTGKFADSYGREISINNTIFITTSNIQKGIKSHHPDKDFIRYPEEIILSAKKCQMQLLNKWVDEDAKYRQEQDRVVRVAPREGITNKLQVNKRKLIDTIDLKEQSSVMQKWRHKASTSHLDLNLPVEEMEENDEHEDYNSDCDSNSDNSEAWLEGFFEHVDAKVVTKPFDFDALAENVIERINHHFKRIFEYKATLEIDYEVMVQILAAAWLSDNKRAVADWTEQVLCGGFAEAKQKYKSTECSLKLIAAGALVAEEQAHSLCLPSSISLN